MTYEFNLDSCMPENLVYSLTHRQQAGWELLTMACSPSGFFYILFRRPVTGTDHK